MGAWDAVKYGWNVVYWVTIEGIPTIFTERALGLTLPSGYEAEDASLVIDDSSEIGSEIDRRRGLGAGLSLGFRLLDTATVRQYIKLPAHTAELTQDESATANTIHVESTSGWPATGRFWLGHELVTYTGKTATTFTGCARGIVGLAYQHRLVSAGNLATSSPRWWRGRVVTLWASPVNQAGLPSGTTLQTDAVQVWRGKVSDGPNRAMAWWDFQADALERVLDRPLAAKLSGKIVPTATIYLAPTQMVCSFKVVAKNAAGATQWAYDFEFSPFATSNPTTYFSGDQLRQRIALQFVSAMTQAGGIANVDNLIWQPVAAEAGKGGQVMPGYRAAISYPGNGNVYNLYQDLSFVCGTKGHLSTQGWQYFPAALPATVLATDWYTGDSPLESQEFFGAYTDFITVQLDSGLDALIPTKGLLKIKPKQDKPPFVAVYKGRTFGAAGVVFGPLKLANGTGIPAVSMNELMGGSVEVIFTDEGSANVLALRCLESSGTGLRSATYDTLNEASGYGLPSGYVDEDTFGALLGSGPVGQLDLRTSPGGASFADIFGGLLVLAQLAVVSRTVDGRTSLACVRTTPIGLDYYVTIKDADLLSISGDAVDVQTKLTPLNRITVTRAPYGTTWSQFGEVSGGDDEAEDTSIFSDLPAILALGDESVEAKIPAIDNNQLTQFALPMAITIFAGDQTLQAVSLQVPPWVSAQVGDLVKLELTHPSLWDYAANAPGYNGVGRVVGRTLELRTLRCKLTVLINSGIKTKTLAPAALVTAFVGPAGGPSTIDVGLQYLTHFQQALVQNGWAWCAHYKPGQTENTGLKFAVSAATKVGAVCRLTVMGGSWAAGSLSLAERSTITVPITNDSNDWQKNYTHAADGSVWS